MWEFAIRFFAVVISAGSGKKMTEVQQQTQGIKLRQDATRVTPFFYEFRALRRRRERTLENCRRVVIEAKISRSELLFENRHAGEQRQRSALHAIRRTQKNLTLALKERARNPSANIFGKSQRPIVEVDTKIGAVNGAVANVIHALRIKRDGAKAGIEGVR